ncbi:predicted protein [Naegleria gruberi]|uniref:Predicted protein n=1 Tax=Naegleria gruberi TaxID=5762 RepID=D2V9B0_NAEGR|nr:uncharacterized protein NAEGRDRAFT_65377 [Naegleria gruberi]EFC46561.1 predicted protein [Naegleria gruberi]|eukprot:XP_002679305.1 predicted protein [Naegleria gruberi strain NEG-M]
MPSGNLVIDKNSDIFVDSPQVSLSSPSILVSADGKTIIFRVYFVDGRELLNYDKVTLIYGYNLLKGPMKTEDFISQLRWHNSFTIPVSNISFKFFYENGVFNQKSIQANRDYYSYSQSVSGTTYNILEFNATNVTTGSLFVGAFNVTNLKYSNCEYGQQQADNLFFYSIIIPLLIGFTLVMLLSLIIILFQRCCRRRSSVLDQEIAHSHMTNISNTRNSPTMVTPMKEQEGKSQQTGLYYVTNTFNNLENNDGFTGVVVSHLTESPNSLPTLPSSGIDEVVIQYTPTLNSHNVNEEPEQTV